MIKVFICPLHIRLEDRGSETGWSYEYVTFLKSLQVKGVVGKKIDDIKNNENIQIIEVQKSRYQMTALNSLLFHLNCYLNGKKILKSWQPDILHHFLPFSIGATFNLTALLAGRRVPFIIGPIQVPHTYSEDNKLQNKLKRLFQVLSNKTLKRADVIVAINEDAKKLMIRSGVSESKIKVIPPGINVNQFVYTSRGFNKNRIITVGQLTPRKATDLIIRAVAEVTKVIPTIHLDILGDGPEKESLETLANELGISGNITFHGRVDRKRIPTYYQRSEAFVSMSRSESWGQVYLEAMACGVPIISSKNSGSVSIIEDGISGFLVDQEDYQNLADKLTHLLRSKELANAIKKTARKKVEDKFDWEHAIIPQYLKLYKKLINNS